MLSNKQAFEQSLEVLAACASPHGFRASANAADKYGRVWARDSMIASLAALISGEPELINQVEKSLHTLIQFQTKHGFIPSNVDPKKREASYGGTAGRVDSTLWFVIVFGQYVKRTRNLAFLRSHYRAFHKAISLAHLYEFNERGLIYVPRGGDWADEYIQEGYVLYDQLLYYQATKEAVWVNQQLKKDTAKYRDGLKKLKQKIAINYWLEKKNLGKKSVYHPALFRRAIKQKKFERPYLLPFFNPSEYGFRFDGFANGLALLFSLLPKNKEAKLIRFLKNQFGKRTHHLIPAFTPPITPKDREWLELKENYSGQFKNRPHEYHNGGLWPMITGFYAAALTKKEPRLAHHFLKGINSANSRGGRANKWGFPEYLNGKTRKPGGRKLLAWSAAAGIIAHQTVIGKKKLLV